MMWSLPQMYDFNFISPFLGIFMLPLVAWSVAWKGWALWKAARSNSVAWFIALLVVNTMGILEILYIFVFSKPSEAKKKR